MSAIYAIVPTAFLADINLAFYAMRGNPAEFVGKLTTDNPATVSSPVTHHHMYDASANPQDFSNFAAAKAGTALPPDVNGDPVAWGVGDIISESDAFAAFASLELWANDSSENPMDFAEGRRDALGLSMVPEEW